MRPTGTILKRIVPTPAPRPHHVHVSPGRHLRRVRRVRHEQGRESTTPATDTLLGEYEAKVPTPRPARSHAGVFGKGGEEPHGYVANDVTNELLGSQPRTGERLLDE